MDFTTFKNKLTEYLPEDTELTIGNDFGVNYSILVDTDGYIHIRKRESFLRVKTSICIKDIEFRKDDHDENIFYLIAGNDGLEYFPMEDTFYFCENGEPSGWGTAFEHFTKFPV